MNCIVVSDRELNATLRRLGIRKKIPSTSACAQKAQSTQTPRLKAVNARAARTSSQGELYWVSSDWGDVRQHVTVKKVCSAAGIRTVSSLMSPQYWSSIEFASKELACTLLNLLWTGIFRCYPTQDGLHTLRIVESNTQIVRRLAVPVTYIIVRTVSLNSTT